MRHIKACPVCKHNEYTHQLNCKDYTVSHETFSIVSCTRCGFLFTNPQPLESNLARYYESKAYISHTSKANSLIDRIYLIVRSFTLKTKLALISGKVAKPGAILDYGCGTGDFLQVCKENNWQIRGVEPSSTAREKSIQLTKAEINQSLDDVDGTYDVITLWHVLEHVPNLPHIVASLSNKLKDDGTLFIAVPNHKSHDAKKYKDKWAAYDVPRHLWHFDQSSMQKLMARFSLKIQRTVPMKFDSYYVSMLSEKYKSTNKLTIGGLVNAFLTGLVSNLKAQKTGDYSSLIYIIRK